MSNATEVRERPVMMSGPEVKAVLSGEMTQKRWAVQPQNSSVLGYPVAHSKRYWPYLLFRHGIAKRSSIWGKGDVHISVPFNHPDDENAPDAPLDDLPWYRVRPIWDIGDRLWVKEPTRWRDGRIVYDADGTPTGHVPDGLVRDYCSAAFMPKVICRLRLEVTDVQAEPALHATPWQWVVTFRPTPEGCR